MRRASPASDHGGWLIAAYLLCVISPSAGQDVEPRGSLSEAVVVESGDTCMTTETIVRRLSSWLRRDEIDASIRIVVRPGTQTASFSFQRGDEAPAERHFDVLPQECAARLDAVTLALALAIDPSVLSALLPSEPPTVSNDANAEADDGQSDSGLESETGGGEVNASPSSLDDTPRESESRDSPASGASASESARRYSIVLGGGASFGVVPGVSAIGSLSFEIELGRIVTLRAGGLITSQTQSEIGRGEVGIRLGAARLDGCGGWTFGIARGDICVGLGVGASIAEGSGFTQDLRATGTWLAALGRASITLPRDTRVGVRLVGDGIVPLIRPRVHVSDDGGNVGQIRAVSAFSGMLSAEFLVRWP